MPRALLPQDVVVLAKLVSSGGTRPAIAQLASDLFLSPSQVHASLKRLERARLAEAQSGRPILRAVEEFLIHAVKYVFPAQRGETTRGVPDGVRGSAVERPDRRKRRSAAGVARPRRRAFEALGSSLSASPCRRRQEETLSSTSFSRLSTPCAMGVHASDGLLNVS